MLQPLPEAARQIVCQYDVPPRLLAHLRLVHEVTVHLCTELVTQQLLVAFDQDAVHFGAATHDIGKIVIRAELSGPGCLHEAQGRSMLLAHGVSPHYARFAQTHGTWQEETHASLEDLLVALADTCWKGTRDALLEQRLATLFSEPCHRDWWEVWLALDILIEQIAADGAHRVHWQAQFPLG